MFTSVLTPAFDLGIIPDSFAGLYELQGTESRLATFKDSALPVVFPLWPHFYVSIHTGLSYLGDFGVI